MEFVSTARVVQALPVLPLLHIGPKSCAALSLLEMLELSAAFTQMSLHCILLHEFKSSGVERLSSEVGIKLGIRLADRRVMLPVAPAWYLCIKTNLHKGVPETIN